MAFVSCWDGREPQSPEETNRRLQMTKNEIGILEKLGDLPTNWIYLLVVIIMTVPILIPLKTPFSVKSETLAVYNIIEELPPGSFVIIEGGNQYGFLIEIKECLQAVLRHLYSRDLKIVFISFSADNRMFHEIVRDFVGISKDEPFNGKVYGVDWVDLGYITGGSSALAQFAANPQSFGFDSYGTPTKDLPIMNEIGAADTWGLCIEDSGSGVSMAIRQVGIPYETKMISLNTAGWYPFHIVYVKSGILSGMTMGIRGAGEYEKLLGYVGLGHSGTDMLNMTHGMIIVLVILGNLSYFSQRVRKKEVSA